MPHRPPRKSKRSPKDGDATDDRKRSDQFAAQRRVDMATRSILSRFQNRKSEKKK